MEISPQEVPAGATHQEFVAEVPAELDNPTTEVRLEVPEGFEVTNVSSPSGWQGNLSGRSIVWSGGEISPDEIQERSRRGLPRTLGSSAGGLSRPTRTARWWSGRAPRTPKSRRR